MQTAKSASVKILHRQEHFSCLLIPRFDLIWKIIFYNQKQTNRFITEDMKGKQGKSKPRAEPKCSIFIDFLETK